MARERSISYYSRNNINCGSVVWMGNEEYRAMMSRIRELKSRPGCSREVMDEFERQIRRLIEDNQRIKQYMEQSSREADRELSRIEKEAEQRLLVYSRKLDHIEDSIKETEKSLRDTRRMLDEEKRIREHGKRLAKEYQAEAIEAFNAIAEDPYMKKFHKNDLLALAQLLENMNGDIPADTISGLALQVLGEVAKLKVQLVSEKARFESEYIKALEALIRVQKARDVYRKELFFDSAQKFNVDLDFWTGNRFEQLERDLEYMDLHLKRDRLADGYMVPEVKADIETIVQLGKRMDGMVEEIFKLNELSELTEACGQMASQILSEQFYYTLVEQGFENDDPRGIYVVRMQRADIGHRIELFFSRSGDSVSFTYHMSLTAYVDEKIMATFFGDFSSQVPAVTLNDVDHSQHIDPTIAFTRDGKSRIEVSQEVKTRYGLSQEATQQTI